MAARAAARRQEASTPAVVFEARDLELIRDAATLRTRAADLKARGCHVIAPPARTSHLAESFGVAVTIIDVDPDQHAGQVYHDLTLMHVDELAFTRMQLQFFSLALGLSWLPSSRCVFTGNGTQKDYRWHFRADAALTGYDGRPSTINGTAEVDLRDGSPQIGGWSAAKWRYLVGKNAALPKAKREKPADLHIHGWTDVEVAKTRRFGVRLAETKAKNAAVRSLGLKSSYTLEELARPFVVFRVVYLPNMADPVIAHSVHEHAMRGAAALYAIPPVAPFAGGAIE